MIEQILQADRYLQVDQVDKAREVYQRVADADPGNAIAVVGLARCSLAEGDDARAYELAGQALEIDPENEMARRMEARLSEILASRGEAVERPDAASTSNPYEMRSVITTDEVGTDGHPGSSADGVAARADSEAAPSAEPDPPAPVDAGPPPSTTTGDESSPSQAKPPAAAKEPPVRKSFFDRLMGR